MQEELTGVSRRDLLKAVGATAAVAVAGGVISTTAGAKEALADEIPAAAGHIATNPLKCSGCKTCMIVCALYHGNEVGPNRARLKVTQATIDLFNTTITTCKQCAHAECYYVCHAESVGAMYVDKETGARVIDPNKCVGCLKCVKACPQYPNAPIWFNEKLGVAFKCDLCGGEPQCVKYCPMSANWSPKVYPEDEHPLRFEKHVVAEA